MLMSATLVAAGHLGKDYLENLHSTNNQPQRTIKQVFDVTKKLITGQTEIQEVSKIGWSIHHWQRTTLLLTKQSSYRQQKCMYSPILTHGKIRLSGLQVLLSIESWIDSTESRWSSIEQFSQDSLHCRFSPNIHNMMTEMQCEPEQFPGRIIFMSMLNDVVW